MTLRLDAPSAPNLPLGQIEYTRQYQDGLNNVLRLYFNRIDAPLQSLFGAQGGRFLNFPYAKKRLKRCVNTVEIQPQDIV